MSLLFHFCCVRCLPCTDEERDRGGQDLERLEAQDDQDEYGGSEEADESHDLKRDT